MRVDTKSYIHNSTHKKMFCNPSNEASIRGMLSLLKKTNKNNNNSIYYYACITYKVYSFGLAEIGQNFCSRNATYPIVCKKTSIVAQTLL